MNTTPNTPAAEVIATARLRHGQCLAVFEQTKGGFLKIRATIYRSDIEIDSLWFSTLEAAQRWAQEMMAIEAR